MAGGERLRLFVALLLPDETVARFVEWQTLELAGRPGLRIVPPANLHVTVAFLGSTPAEEVPKIAELLREEAVKADPFAFGAVRYRETRSVGMVVFADEEGRAGAFAEGLFAGLERLGVYEREQRTWLPHVTVVRFRQRPLLTPPIPSLGGIVTSGAAVMMSRLRPGGAEYVVLESVSLGG